MPNSYAPQLPTDYSYLDRDEFRAKYTERSGTQIRFFVGGMRCGKCVRTLEQIPLRLKGVRRLRVELSRSLAEAEIDPAEISFSDLANEIARLGFQPIPITPEQGADALGRQTDRRELIRLAIAGALAGNIMTFSFAAYFGAEGEWLTAFQWLSFVLYLPVLTYVAWPFYVGAWNSLKNKQLSIDLPMAIASVSGFVFSTVQLLRGRDDIYFDSLSGFLFLILAARWLQRRMQRRFLRPELLTESSQLGRARVLGENGWDWAPTESLKPGSEIFVTMGESLPADSELVTESALFSLAWLSGENSPRIFRAGAMVPAGARLVAGSARLIAKKPLAETGFGRILQQAQQFSLSENRVISLADKWAQWLLGIVFTTALIFLALYSMVSVEEAIRRSLALIILACPCAMAFGTPLALAAALRKARQAGLIVQDANVFENTRRVETVFFDKTGTLTDTELTLREDPKIIPEDYKSIILGLENESLHPIAFALRKALADENVIPIPLRNRKEIPGRGVEGSIGKRFFELKSGPANGYSHCVLFENGTPVFHFTFAAEINRDAREVLVDLRRRGYRVALLSGDKQAVADQLSKDLDFEFDEVHCEVTPEMKAEIVGRTPKAMMVGDGVNDSLAMMRATVGVAVRGGVEAALKSSGVYLCESGLKGITRLIEISEGAASSIKTNLMVSVIYNSVGGALALLGYINPLVAALLMPASSGFILLSTWWRGIR